MQVDPKPSPWPCVVMLLALLLFCLAVPRFWQSGESATNSPGGGSNYVASDARAPIALDATVLSRLGSGTALNPFTGSGFHEFEFNLPAGMLSESSLISLCPPPTIEELIETARLGSIRHDFVTGLHAGESVGSPSYASGMSFTTGPTHAVRPARSALLTAMLSGVGRAIVQHSLSELVQPLAAAATRLHQLWPGAISGVSDTPAGDTIPVSPGIPLPDPSSPVASTLRLVNPNDRLAMLPSPVIPHSQHRPPIATPPQANSDDSADAGPWCVPQALLNQIERLSRHPISAAWAQATIAQLRAVTQRDRWENGDVSSLLLGLSQSAQQAIKMADETGDDRLRVELLRAHWALARRLDCWAAVHEIRVAHRASGRIAARGSLNALLDGEPQPALGHTDAADLSIELEAYEGSRDPQIGRQVTEKQHALEASPSSLDRTLADAVEQHYRNANVRIAITAELLNRFVGEQRSEVRPVRERIAGTPVRGQSHTMSESSIRLQPAEGRWQLDVEAQGVVDSRTLADGGRARLRSRSATDFIAQKTIVVDTSGVQLQPTVVDATNHNRLVGVTTDFDWVPLLRSYARNRAIQEYRAKRPRARAEVESKVAALAVEQMDEQTLVAIDRVEQEIRSRLLVPMAKFGVDLTPIELTTTHDRLVARLRVAGTQQLGGHTPRPRALSDSLASMQVHETAFTNAAVSLGLDGMRYTAPELQALLREKFPRLAADTPLETRRDTVFEFAYRDAVQFHIDDGRLELMLGLSCLELQGRQMRDIVVHAFYVPAVDGLDSQLVRDGPLGIEGRLSSADRARLHNVFNTVLSEERRLPIVRLEQPGDSRLTGLAITQLVLEDGWIGVAIGPGTPHRVAEQSRSLR
jgi:hypothetical protein